MSAVIERDNVPAAVAKYNITEPQWRTLCNNLYPGANPQSVVMVIEYCKARGLDPLKKPCHIVPMRAKDSRTGQWGWRDVVMPGIYEYRTTATRTGLYLGHSKPEYGPTDAFLGVTAPEWCDITVYRWNPVANMKTEFPARVYFAEVCGTKRENDRDVANDRWRKAPVQMLTKCAEAAALREAFPDEFGGSHTFEEMDGRASIDAEPEVRVTSVAKLVTQEAIDAGVLDDNLVSDAVLAMKDALDTDDGELLARVWHALDQETKTAAWTQFDSKQRSAMKKMLAAQQDMAAEGKTND